jgi:hypothetical protein
MGWTFSYSATTKQAVIDECLRDVTYETETVSSKAVKHSLNGNHLWYVIEQTVKATGEAQRVICLSLLQYDKRDRCYGHKDMSEDCGPCYYDCPLGFLDMVTPSDSTFAEGWREKVREHHASKAERRHKEPITVGKTYRLRNVRADYANEVVTITEVRHTGRTGKGRQYVGILKGRGVYRFSPRVLGEEITGQSMAPVLL